MNLRDLKKKSKIWRCNCRLLKRNSINLREILRKVEDRLLLLKIKLIKSNKNKYLNNCLYMNDIDINICKNDINIYYKLFIKYIISNRYKCRDVKIQELQ